MEHTVYFDDITLIPLPDEIVTNGNFANDLTSWSTWTENGSTYSVDAGEQCFVANHDVRAETVSVYRRRCANKSAAVYSGISDR